MINRSGHPLSTKITTFQDKESKAEKRLRLRLAAAMPPSQSSAGDNRPSPLLCSSAMLLCPSPAMLLSASGPARTGWKDKKAATSRL